MTSFYYEAEELKNTYVSYNCSKKRILFPPDNQRFYISWTDYLAHRHILLRNQSRASLSGSAIRTANTICHQYEDWRNTDKGWLSDFHMRGNCPSAFSVDMEEKA